MEPPYDRALALAAQVRTLKDHFIEVRCGCGERRVIGLGQMAKDPRTPTATMAHVALRIRCHGCPTGPTSVHLCATVYGLEPPKFAGGTVWTMPLVERSTEGRFTGSIDADVSAVARERSVAVWSHHLAFAWLSGMFSMA